MQELELSQFMEKQNHPLSDEQLSQLKKYAELLKQWNTFMNLTAITEEEEVYEKHFYDSLLPFVHNEIKGNIADVGTGAGFPGLVWAIAEPSIHMTLIEPTGKRCNFLNEVITQLQLKNVTVENERAEDYAKNHRETFDVVTARAVANLPVLSELCVPLVKQGGFFLALKGSQGNQEALDASHALKTLGCENPSVTEMTLPSGDTRVFVLCPKVKPTPKNYPRPYAKIKKKPL